MMNLGGIGRDTANGQHKNFLTGGIGRRLGGIIIPPIFGIVIGDIVRNVIGNIVRNY